MGIVIYTRGQDILQGHNYVIPWESRVNSCQLRFSYSEFYADSKKIGCNFFRSP